jgi:NADPH:quinone reductase-like Zn-dependent oxidoreductase
MASKPNREIGADDSAIYRIRIRGHLGEAWIGAFDGLSVIREIDGDTLITGPIADQAALHGLLRKVRDLGLPLVSVARRSNHPTRGETVMRAVMHEQYGGPEVLQVREIEVPTPADDQVLIRVHAAAVTAYDVRARGLKLPSPLLYIPARLSFGWRRPKQPIPGDEFAGEIVAIGKEVNGFAVGDRVFGFTGRAGASAEYLCRRPGWDMLRLPDNVTFAEGAGVLFGGVTARYFLRDLTRVQSGQRVLINGASGAVGTASVQLAKHYGATVTGVCSTANLQLVQSLGADHVIDYTVEDFTDSGGRFDVVFDAVGTSSFGRARRVLAPHGLYLNAVIGFALFGQQWWTGRRQGMRVLTGIAIPKEGDLAFLSDLMESGSLRVPIDRCYPLNRAAAAHRYVESGHKRGNVILTTQ